MPIGNLRQAVLAIPSVERSYAEERKQLRDCVDGIDGLWEAAALYQVIDGECLRPGDSVLCPCCVSLTGSMELVTGLDREPQIGVNSENLLELDCSFRFKWCLAGNNLADELGRAPASPSELS